MYGYVHTMCVPCRYVHTIPEIIPLIHHAHITHDVMCTVCVCCQFSILSDIELSELSVNPTVILMREANKKCLIEPAPIFRFNFDSSRSIIGLLTL